MLLFYNGWPDFFADGTRTDSVYLGSQLIAEADNENVPPPSPTFEPIINLTVSTVEFKGDPCRTFNDCEAFPTNPIELDPFKAERLPGQDPEPHPRSKIFIHQVQWTTKYAAQCDGAINKSINGK